MAQGTITVTNGSKNVQGVGTNFTTFSPGSFISLTLVGVVYTIAIDKITDDANLVLSVPFDGATTSGAAFVYSDVGSMALATMGVTVQAQKALRMMIADATNWREVYSDKQDITVTLPDGTQFSGYSWGYISKLLKEINVPLLESLRDQAVSAAAAAEASEHNAETHSNDAATSAISAEGYSQSASGSATAASGSASASAGSAAESLASENSSRNSASESKEFRDQAEEFANQIDPSALMRKENNLNDVASKAAAWLNLQAAESGGVPLRADGVAPGDAVTVRQLSAVSGGGATLAGVMNNRIGAVEWFNGSRANIPAGYIAADGQLENRTDPRVADLWGAVNAGLFVKVDTDSIWIAGGNPNALNSNRGAYSPGNGTTTFRVPDLNGARKNGDNLDASKGVASFPGVDSEIAPFLHGDAGGSVNGIWSSGAMKKSSLPNIAGTIGIALPNVSNVGVIDPTGAFLPIESSTSVLSNATGLSFTSGARGINLSASRSSDVYGRTGLNIALPNSITGIWIIRANGNFNAPGTAYNVIVSDAVAPANGQTVNGGKLISVYQVAGAEKYSARLQSYGVVGVGHGGKIIVSESGADKAEFVFGGDGSFIPAGNILMQDQAGFFSKSMIFKKGNVEVDVKASSNGSLGILNFTAAGSVTRSAIFVDGGYCCKPGSGNDPVSSSVFNYNWTGQLEAWIDTTRIGAVSLVAVSDRELKKEIEYLDSSIAADEALARVMRWRVATFKYKARGSLIPESETNLGFIANDLVEVSPHCVKGNGLKPGFDENEPADAYYLDTTAQIAELTQAVQALAKIVSEQKEEIEKLKSR